MAAETKEVLERWLDAAEEFTQHGGFVPFMRETIAATIIHREWAATLDVALNVAESSARFHGYSQINTPEAAAHIEKVLLGSDGFFKSSASSVASRLLGLAIQEKMIGAEDAARRWDKIDKAISQRRKELGFEGPTG